MNTQEILDRLRSSVGSSTAHGLTTQASLPEGEPSLLGLFQAFRPEGLERHEFLDAVPGGNAFRRRMGRLYDAVRRSERSDGMKDAYFVVRNPAYLQAGETEDLAGQFLAHALAFARSTGEDSAPPLEVPTIRVLVGKPPKLPKAPRERSALTHLLLKQLPERLDRLFAQHDLAQQLSEALYFVACDPWLRDFLRWPLLASHEDCSLSPETRQHVDHALANYFELWRHGIKFRSFSDQQVDFYLPRYTEPTP